MNPIISTYIHAAWYFASSVLWPRHEHTPEEEKAALKDLETFFTTAKDINEAFETFCGRVMISVANKDSCPILHPRIWLNPVNMEGLTAANSRSNAAKSMRRKVQNFDSIVRVISNNYMEYLHAPVPEIFQKCNDELEALGRKDWMSVFYDAINYRPATETAAVV